MTRQLRGPQVALRVLATVMAAVLVAGCDYGGITSVPLPFREGTGGDALEVTVHLREASGLTPNSEVKVNDVTVGSVKSLKVDGWRPVAVVGLDKGVELPSNAVARVGQKSLLGAKYLELTTPLDQAPSGRLESGDTLVLSTTGNYPQTEQVLASLSLVLNGSGLQQVRSITDELDNIVAGREPQAREFINRFNTFISSLNRQRDDIVDVIDRLNSLSETLSSDDVVATAIDRLPEAFNQLDKNRDQLTKALTALSGFGQTAEQVVGESGDDLVANLRDLRPALAGLARSGSDLTESLSVAATYPFPGNTSFPKMFQGDYGNLFITLDVSPELLARNLLRGFLPTSEGTSLFEGPPLGAGDGPPAVEQDPRGGPNLVDNLLGGLPDLLGGSSANGSPSTSGLAGLLPGLLGRTTTAPPPAADTSTSGAQR